MVGKQEPWTRTILWSRLRYDHHIRSIHRLRRRASLECSALPLFQPCTNTNKLSTAIQLQCRPTHDEDENEQARRVRLMRSILN